MLVYTNEYDKNVFTIVKQLYIDRCQMFNSNNNNNGINSNIGIDDGAILFIMKNMKNSNSLGFDKLSTNMIKNAINVLSHYITKLINMILAKNIIPNGFNHCIIVPIKKNKNIKNFDCDNFRPLSVSNVFAQILEAVILKKTPNLDKINNNQFGFRNKLSTVHPLFIVNEVGKRFIKEGSPLYLEKAFDHLWRDGLLFKLKDKMDDMLWYILLNYYNNSCGYLKLNNIIYYNKILLINQGVKQGGVYHQPYLTTILMI